MDAPEVGDMMRFDCDDDRGVVISDGARHGLVVWDDSKGTYRTEIDLFGLSGRPGSAPWRSGTGCSGTSPDRQWQWLADPRPSAIPGRLTIGEGLVELPTVDSLLNRLATLGFAVDGHSRSLLFALRRRVAAECGSTVFIGSTLLEDTMDRTLDLVLADGRRLPIRPRFDHVDHRFGWGCRTSATVRTAAALVGIAWSPSTAAATEAAILDLAVTILAEVKGGFVWRIESVADWIAAETGDLNGSWRPGATEIGRGHRTRFEQLALEL